MSESLVDKRYCNGCWYISKSSTSFWSCDYIFIAGKCRPCPAGIGCTEKLVKKKRKDSLTVSKRGRKKLKEEN